MTWAAGADGAPGGWAVVFIHAMRHEWRVRKVRTIEEIFADEDAPAILAVDIPIGLLDAYSPGGRPCDIELRKRLGNRGASVFPAPIRPALRATSWRECAEITSGSSPLCKGINRQTYGIVDKVRDVDDLLRARPDLRDRIREVHPEYCFAMLNDGEPMRHRKTSCEGREERLFLLRKQFSFAYRLIDGDRKKEGLSPADVLDAFVACWTGLRLLAGEARSIPSSPAPDAAGLPMAIWA